MPDTPSTSQAEAPPQQVQQAPQFLYSNDLSDITSPSFNWDSNVLLQQFKSFKRYCELVMYPPTFKSRMPTEIVTYILLWIGLRVMNQRASPAATHTEDHAHSKPT